MSDPGDATPGPADYALSCVRSYVAGGRASEPPQGAFYERRAACFVTLKKRGELRGCIGTLEPAEASLGWEIARNAQASALRDPRFEPLSEEELAGLSIEVSLLSTPEPLSFTDEDDLMRQVEPRRHGLVLEYGRHRSTFLPQVWEQLPDARDFLRHLKAKAGLPPDFWSEGIRVSCYAVEKWGER